MTPIAPNHPKVSRSGQLLACAFVAAVILPAGCAETDDECTDPELVGALELGIYDKAGEFIPIVDGQDLAVVNLQALYGYKQSMRADQLDPSMPQPSITVHVDGYLAGANKAGETSDMLPDGEAYVLQNLDVLFQVNPCCFNCSEAIIQASLVDLNCHECTSSARVILQPSTSCPPTTFCSCDASECPAPLTPEPCAEE